MIKPKTHSITEGSFTIRRRARHNKMTISLGTCLVVLSFVCLIVYLFIFLGLYNLTLAYIFTYCLCIFLYTAKT